MPIRDLEGRVRDLVQPPRDLQGRILDLSVRTDVRQSPSDREDPDAESHSQLGAEDQVTPSARQVRCRPPATPAQQPRREI